MERVEVCDALINQQELRDVRDIITEEESA
jgi:hypothetical protein